MKRNVYAVIPHHDAGRPDVSVTSREGKASKVVVTGGTLVLEEEVPRKTQTVVAALVVSHHEGGTHRFDLTACQLGCLEALEQVGLDPAQAYRLAP